MIAGSGVFVEGVWLSTDWHSHVYQVLSMLEWNSFLRRSSSDRKTRNPRSRSNGDQTPKTALSGGSLAIEVSVMGCDHDR